MNPLAYDASNVALVGGICRRNIVDVGLAVSQPCVNAALVADVARLGSIMAHEPFEHDVARSCTTII
jgi:hypothetical protein